MEAVRALVFAGLMFILPASAIASDAGGQGYISPDRVYSLMKEGSGLWLVDVRGPAAYEECHIEGSINIPLEQLLLKRLPKERMYILVDDSLGSMKADEAVRELAAKGMEKVYVLEGGLYEWARAGRALAGNAARAYTPEAVTPEEFKQVSTRGVRMSVYDLRSLPGKEMPGAEKVQGKNLDERVGRLMADLSKNREKGIASKLKKPAPMVLVFSAADDALRAASMVSRAGYGDVRYIAGGYEAMTASGTKTASVSVGGCPTCPKPVK